MHKLSYPVACETNFKILGNSVVLLLGVVCNLVWVVFVAGDGIVTFAAAVFGGTGGAAYLGGNGGVLTAGLMGAAFGAATLFGLISCSSSSSSSEGEGAAEANDGEDLGNLINSSSSSSCVSNRLSKSILEGLMTSRNSAGVCFLLGVFAMGDGCLGASGFCETSFCWGMEGAGFGIVGGIVFFGGNGGVDLGVAGNAAGLVKERKISSRERNGGATGLARCTTGGSYNSSSYCASSEVTGCAASKSCTSVSS